MSTNQDFIDAYKGDDKIIADYYRWRQQDGKVVELKGIINPLRIDNRQLMSPTDNQTTTPHCAAYSAATLAESIYWKRTGILKQFDSHQVYALAKQIDGEVKEEGTYLECALKAAMQLGAFENTKNINIGLFYNDRTQNTVEMTKFLIHKYDFLQVGFQIDEGWYSVTNQMYQINSRGRNLGGHAVNLAGYDQNYVYVLNQWGTSWGANGYAVMSWDLYLKELMYGAYVKNAYSEC